MTILRRKSEWLAIVAGMILCWTSGCQTYFPETGQTLPSGYYLKHQPQYVPPSPAFPLPKEEAGLEQANSNAAANPGTPVAR